MEQHEETDRIEQKEVADLKSKRQFSPTVLYSVLEEVLWEVNRFDKVSSIFRTYKRGIFN